MSKDWEYEPPKLMSLRQDAKGVEEVTRLQFELTEPGDKDGATALLVMEWPPQEAQQWQMTGRDGKRRRVTGITLHVEKEQP